MATIDFQCEVKADFDHLWKSLIAELEHPEQFNQGIMQSKILERFNNGVLRTVSVPDADVREKITFQYEKGIVSSHLVGHADLVGVIEKRIRQSPDKPGFCLLSSHIEWESKSDRVDSMIRRNVERFVTQTLEAVKRRAESEKV
ncbi:MAG: DUF1857 family protein [Chitinophagaceae bacterium]|nr:DUF1857 family protein [Oligoflexus sp.]